MTGYTVNTDSLATRIGELRSLVQSVESAASSLDVHGGDLGPAGIGSAVAEVAGKWRDGLGEMKEKIDTMAENVSHAVTNYDELEAQGQEAFRLTIDGELSSAIRTAQKAGSRY